MSFKVTLVRHAETDYNRQHLIHSHSDGSLNETGLKQAQLLGTHLANEKFTKVYSSDMERTKSTAKGILGKLVHPGPEIVLDKNLREKSYGEWDGRPAKVVYDAAQKAGMKIYEITPPGGETYEDALGRVLKFFESLCSNCDSSNEDENILIVTHGLWMVFFFRFLDQFKNELFELENFDWSIPKYGAPLNTCRTQFTVSKTNAGQKRKIAFSCITDVTHLNGFAPVDISVSKYVK